jgi:hypothetical protein
MSATTNVIVLSYDAEKPHLLTHLCRDEHTLCGMDAGHMQRFEASLRGRQPIEDLLDCAGCTRALHAS